MAEVRLIGGDILRTGFNSLARLSKPASDLFGMYFKSQVYVQAAHSNYLEAVRQEDELVESLELDSMRRRFEEDGVHLDAEEAPLVLAGIRHEAMDKR